MKKLLFFIIAAGLSVNCMAHPMPNSILLLDIKTGNIKVELQLPLAQLQLIYQYDKFEDSTNLLAKREDDFRAYILAHLKPSTNDGRAWKVEITGMKLDASEQTSTGPYQELIVYLLMTPPPGANTRNLLLNYDVIIHQVPKHRALVSIRRDWETGKQGESVTEVGVIETDIHTKSVKPLTIHQEAGSWWQGFKGMVNLGINHISEGTDHLLFLLVLLLPATLMNNRRSWGKYAGTKYSVIRLLKIITAFTVGHSVTLLLGTIGWIRLPSQPVEVIIAFSILITAIHAIRPIFPGKEIYIAAGFGLVHGLGFAGILYDLELEPGRLALSILGFNIGIELMQLFVMVVTVPWLILLSRTRSYSIIRIGAAVLSGFAAIIWMTERITGQYLTLGLYIHKAARLAPWGVIGLAILSLILYRLHVYGENRSKYQRETERIPTR